MLWALVGVADAENYYSSKLNTLHSTHVRYSKSLQHCGTRTLVLDDAEKALQWFFDDCHEVEPQDCALYEETPTLIQKTYESTVESFRNHPVPFFTPATNSTPAVASVIDYSSVRSTIFRLLYAPTSWRIPAQLLAGLKQGDVTLAAAAAAPSEVCGVDDTVEELRDFYGAVNSSFSGLVTTRVSCVYVHLSLDHSQYVLTFYSGWKILPAEHFAGE